MTLDLYELRTVSYHIKWAYILLSERTINGFRALGNTEIINELKNSNLVAECSHCSEEFELSKAILFDGMGKFPDIAEQKRKQLLDELSQV